MPDTARLRELLAKATKGPWEIDTERSEGEYGSGPDTSTGYDDFLIGAEINGKWATLLTTENATEKMIEEDYDEDYHRAWDTIGEANANLVTAAINALPALLDRIEALEAGLRKADNLLFDSLYHLRLDEGAKRYHDKVIAIRAARDLLKGSGE